MNRVLIPTAFTRPALSGTAAVRRLAGEAMGTTWSVNVAADVEAERLRAGIAARLERVTAEMSPWRPDSDLCRFNRLPAGAWQRLPPDFATVLRCARDLAAATGGAFDPTIGPLVDLWGFGPLPATEAGPPAAEWIAAARARVGWSRLELDGPASRLRQPGGAALDLCGIAKGHAVDLLAEGLEAEGIRSYLVEIGGELRGRGVKPDGTPWWVAIERPPGPVDGAPPLVVALHGLAIATSGDHRRGFRHAGRLYGHTLDPRTGWPIPPRIAGVSVLHPSCMQADALATAMAVLGLEKGREYAARHGIAALILERDEAGRLHEHPSPAFAAMLD